VAAVNDVEPRHRYVSDRACSPERCEGPIMTRLPAEWPSASQARPTSIESVETVLAG
jgi:hypothetical protein